MHLGDKGQIWSEFTMGVMVLVVCGLLYVILNQVYQQQFKQTAIEQGVYAPNANLIDFSWKVILIPVVVAVVYSWINTARRRMGYGYE
jgi:hypothetical protein